MGIERERGERGGEIKRLDRTRDKTRKKELYIPGSFFLATRFFRNVCSASSFF